MYFSLLPQEADGFEVQFDAVIHQAVLDALEEIQFENPVAVGVGEDEAQQGVAGKLQTEQDDGQHDAGDQHHGEPFLEGGGRNHQEVGAGPLLGEVAVDLGAGADDDDQVSGAEKQVFRKHGHFKETLLENQAEELGEDEAEDGHRAAEEQADRVGVLRVAQVVQEVIPETLEVENVIHG